MCFVSDLVITCWFELLRLLRETFELDCGKADSSPSTSSAPASPLASSSGSTVGTVEKFFYRFRKARVISKSFVGLNSMQNLTVSSGWKPFSSRRLNSEWTKYKPSRRNPLLLLARLRAWTSGFDVGSPPIPPWSEEAHWRVRSIVKANTKDKPRFKYLDSEEEKIKR